MFVDLMSILFSFRLLADDDSWMSTLYLESVKKNNSDDQSSVEMPDVALFSTEGNTQNEPRITTLDHFRRGSSLIGLVIKENEAMKDDENSEDSRRRASVKSISSSHEDPVDTLIDRSTQGLLVECNFEGWSRRFL